MSWTGRDARMSKIAVIGTGYVGLTTGACFAHLGHDVVCADVDADKVARLQRGEIPILEAGLDNLVREGIAGGRLTFVARRRQRRAPTASSPTSACPRPQGADGSADLSYIEDAAREIGPLLPTEAVVVNKSTVPVGSTRVVERALGPRRRRRRVEPRVPPRGLGRPRLPPPRPHRDRRRGPVGRGAGAVALPRHHGAGHRHRPGVGRDDQVRRQRLPRHQDLASSTPSPRCARRSAPTSRTSRSAWATTRASATSSSSPGPGWGGCCFPKDTRAMVRIAEDAGYDFDLLKGVVAVNDEQLAPGGRQDRRPGRRLASRASGSRCGASPSRPAPTTSASRRRWR